MTAGRTEQSLHRGQLFPRSIGHSATPSTHVRITEHCRPFSHFLGISKFPSSKFSNPCRVSVSLAVHWEYFRERVRDEFVHQMTLINVQFISKAGGLVSTAPYGQYSNWPLTVLTIENKVEYVSYIDHCLDSINQTSTYNCLFHCTGRAT